MKAVDYWNNLNTNADGIGTDLQVTPMEKYVDTFLATDSGRTLIPPKLAPDGRGLLGGGRTVASINFGSSKGNELAKLARENPVEFRWQPCTAFF